MEYWPEDTRLWAPRVKPSLEPGEMQRSKPLMRGWGGPGEGTASSG